MNTRFYVTNKVAIYSHDLQTVMVMDYQPRNIVGLPGGHLESNEEPEQAMARELQEELGITVENMKKADFFIRNYGERQETIVLAYTAIAPEGLVTNPSNYKSEHDRWVTRDEVQDLEMADSYKKFVFANWPVASE